MEIKCAGCIYQVVNSREIFVDTFCSCEFDSDEDINKHFEDPCRSETDKVSKVMETSKCADFEKIKRFPSLRVYAKK